MPDLIVSMCYMITSTDTVYCNHKHAVTWYHWLIDTIPILQIKKLKLDLARVTLLAAGKGCKAHLCFPGSRNQAALWGHLQKSQKLLRGQSSFLLCPWLWAQTPLASGRYTRIRKHPWHGHGFSFRKVQESWQRVRNRKELQPGWMAMPCWSQHP